MLSRLGRDRKEIDAPRVLRLDLSLTHSNFGQSRAENDGTHTADLWDATTGTLLATATFTDETPEGWQQVNFAEPVSINAGTTYVASYHTSGNYSADPNLFDTTLTNGPLTAPSSAQSGGNGVYAYGSDSLIPANSFNATSYGVDVIFKGQLAA